ncbi:MAG: hypothetical protein OHK0045_16650 [Raineya sp.]
MPIGRLEVAQIVFIIRTHTARVSNITKLKVFQFLRIALHDLFYKIFVLNNYFYRKKQTEKANLNFSVSLKLH